MTVPHTSRITNGGLLTSIDGAQVLPYFMEEALWCGAC
jgi:hypothetical protein